MKALQVCSQNPSNYISDNAKFIIMNMIIDKTYPEIV